MNLNIILETSSKMKEVLYIILGWLLGLLGQPLAKKVENYFKRKELKKTIFVELKNLGARLCVTNYRIQMHLGIATKSSLNKLKTALEKYGGDWLYPKGMIERIDSLLQTPDDQLNASLNQYEGTEVSYLTLKKLSLPFLDSILENLQIFGLKFQREIFDIWTQISFLNGEIDNAAFQSQLTFDPSYTPNIEVIKKNVKTSYIDIQRRCEFILEKIDNVLQN